MGFRRSIGVSLAETVVALFVLVIAGLGCLQMFHLGMRASTIAEKRSVASYLASKRLTQIQSWARDLAHFRNFASVPTGPDADYPLYPLSTSVSDYLAPSPCSQLQPAGTRELRKSLKRVQVEVGYPPYGPTDRLRVVTLLGEPARELATVSLTATGLADPIPAPPYQVQFTATGTDASGDVIEDLLFDWYVNPGTGNGTVLPADDGRSASFVNHVLLPTGTYAGTGGSCQVQAWARCTGRSRGGDSGSLNL